MIIVMINTHLQKYVLFDSCIHKNLIPHFNFITIYFHVLLKSQFSKSHMCKCTIILHVFHKRFMPQTDTIYFSEKLLCLSASSIQSTKTANEFSPVLSNQSITIIYRIPKQICKTIQCCSFKAKKKIISIFHFLSIQIFYLTSIMSIMKSSFNSLSTLYSKTCVKRPLSKRQKICFQDQLSLNAGQKYCRMLQREHSAILSNFIKLPFVIKIFVLSIFEWPLKTGFTVLISKLLGH